MLCFTRGQPKHEAELGKAYARARSRVIVMDYGGTLTRPTAHMDPALEQLKHTRIGISPKIRRALHMLSKVRFWCGLCVRACVRARARVCACVCRYVRCRCCCLSAVPLYYPLTPLRVRVGVCGTVRCRSRTPTTLCLWSRADAGACWSACSVA